MGNAKNESSENGLEASSRLLAEDELAAESERPVDLDAAAERLVASLSAIPVRPSAPNLEELDLGWDKEDEDDDESLDERAAAARHEGQDSEAFAAAKVSRALRAAEHRLRKHAKAATKQAQRKARTDAQKQMQKGKQKKARTPPQASSRAATNVTPSQRSTRTGNADRVSSAPRTNGSTPRDAGLSKTNQWMLAGAIVIFLSAAAFAAAVSR